MSRKEIALAGALILLIASSAVGYDATLQYVPEITDLTSLCLPQGIKLDVMPDKGVDWPAANGDPLFGAIPLNGATYPIMIDRHDGAADLYVDKDGSGVLQLIPWFRTLLDGSAMASLSFEVPYDGTPEPYQASVMWIPFTPTVITYCRDSYRSGVIRLGETDYKLAVLDDDSDARYDRLDGGTLAIDADGDGELLVTPDSHEIYSLAEPFNLDGTVYKVASVSEDGSLIQIEASDEYVPPKLPLLDGFPAPLFDDVDIDGEGISLDALQGDIVVLDFWASWCAPCVSEIPTLKQIAAEFGDQGVDVVGIDLDRSKRDLLTAMGEHEITYRQIFDSDSGPIGNLYRISGIPMTYVIDRDGVIHARGLRGDALVAAVEELVHRGEADP
jgi:thiol-disulfide isomerase/thioredoxin